MDLSLGIIQLILAGVSSLVLVYLAVPILIRVAYEWDLYDKPDGERKLHTRYVPTLGGIAIFLAFFVSVSISGYAVNIEGYPYLAAALVILFFTGLKDDLVGLSPKKKLIAQAVSIALIIFGCDVFIGDFYGMFGVNGLPFWASLIITLFTMVVVINAYNLIDGIDGLAAGIGLVASLTFGTIFWLSGASDMAVLSYMLSIALVGFLIYNREPAKIFMGDTGSLLVGFLLAILAVQFIGLNDMSGYTNIFGNSSAILPVAILSVPLYDTIRVFYRRAKRSTSPFLPGKDHIHHEFLRMGFTHTKTVLFLMLGTLLVIGIGFILKDTNSHIMLAGVLMATMTFYPTNGTKRRLLYRVNLCPSYIDKASYLPIRTTTERSNPKSSKKEKSVSF